MENVTVMVLNKHYESKKDMTQAIKYMAAEGRNMGKEKLLGCRGRGVSSKPEKAAFQMTAVQEAYARAGKRRMYHMIVSFPENVRDADAIQQAADAIANMLFEKYQVFYGIHSSTDNWHIHFAINAVSYLNGEKWHKNKNEFKEMKGRIYQLIGLR